MADGPLPDPDALRDLRAERDSWAQELFESNRHAAELAISRQALADALATLESRTQAEARRHIEAAERDRDAALLDRDRARDAAHAADARLRRITSSTSWRMTAPLRALLTALLGRPRRDP